MEPSAAITDEEERELIESSERGEWVSIGKIEERRAFWKEIARLAELRRGQKK